MMFYKKTLLCARYTSDTLVPGTTGRSVNHPSAKKLPVHSRQHVVYAILRSFYPVTHRSEGRTRCLLPPTLSSGIATHFGPFFVHGTHAFCGSVLSKVCVRRPGMAWYFTVCVSARIRIQLLGGWDLYAGRVTDPCRSRDLSSHTLACCWWYKFLQNKGIIQSGPPVSREGSDIYHTIPYSQHTHGHTQPRVHAIPYARKLEYTR